MMDLAPDFAALLAPHERSFAGIMALDGEVYRALEGRCTVRIVRGGRAFFVKQHRGVGWGAILAAVVRLRRPVLGADPEWRAIEHLQAAGIATARLAGKGARGVNPARRESFVVLEDLGDVVSLEDLVRSWSAVSPAAADRRRLVRAVAELARRMHASGLNHRDFYLCHILKERTGDGLYLLDLHRAEIRPRVPRRRRVKDLGGLYFSALGAGLTRHDRLRFVAAYEGRPLRAVLAGNAPFWRAVERRAQGLAARHVFADGVPVARRRRQEASGRAGQGMPGEAS